MQNAISPRPDWGPRLQEDRTNERYNDNYGYDTTVSDIASMSENGQYKMGVRM